MNTKVCTKCGEEKGLEEFPARVGSKDGYNNICRLCINAGVRSRTAKKRIEKPKVEKPIVLEKICSKCGTLKSLNAFYNTKKKDGRKRPQCKVCCLEDVRRQRAQDPEKNKKERREYHEKNKERENARNRQYYQDNREEIREKSNQYCKENPEKIRDQKRRHRKKRVDKCKKYQREYVRRRCKEDPLYGLQRNLRSRVATAFRNRGFRKTQPLMELLGVESIAQLEIYLIATAIKNYGYWANFQNYEIDHIIPINSAKNQETLMKLIRYENLQLLYPLHNKEKDDRLDWSIEASKHKLI